MTSFTKPAKMVGSNRYSCSRSLLKKSMRGSNQNARAVTARTSG
jgi:hypothetical protein